MKKLVTAMVCLCFLIAASAGATELPLGNGTGSRPTVEAAGALTMAQSAVPFAYIQ